VVPIVWGHRFVYAGVKALFMGQMGSAVEESLKLKGADQLAAACWENWQKSRAEKSVPCCSMHRNL